MQKFKINRNPEKWIKQLSCVKDDGIYIPLEQYVQEGHDAQYHMLISKEVFIEAYNKWIKGEENV